MEDANIYFKSLIIRKLVGADSVNQFCKKKAMRTELRECI